MTANQWTIAITWRCKESIDSGDTQGVKNSDLLSVAFGSWSSKSVSYNLEHRWTWVNRLEYNTDRDLTVEQYRTKTKPFTHRAYMHLQFVSDVWMPYPLHFSNMNEWRWTTYFLLAIG